MAASNNALSELHAALEDGKTHLLLAASGSVATIKIPNIVAALVAAHPPSRLSIRIILTSSARNFLAGQSAEQPPLRSLLSVPGVDGIYTDEDEWGRGESVGPEGVWRRGGGVLHIELRRWAHLMAVVPLSANTLAKVANGLCDNLLTSVVRAWDAEGRIDGGRKRILVAPAMNVSLDRISPSPHFNFRETVCGHLIEGMRRTLTSSTDSNVAPPHNSQADPRTERGLGCQGGRGRHHRVRLVRGPSAPGEVTRVW